MEVRIKPGTRGVDAFVIDDELTLTKDWATVAKSQGKDLLALVYDGINIVESREAKADEAKVEEATYDFEPTAE